MQPKLRHVVASRRKSAAQLLVAGVLVIVMVPVLARSWRGNASAIVFASLTTNSTECAIPMVQLRQPTPAVRQMSPYFKAVVYAAGAAPAMPTTWQRNPQLRAWFQAQGLIRRGHFVESFLYLREAHVASWFQATGHILLAHKDYGCSLFSWLLAKELDASAVTNPAGQAQDLINQNEAYSVVEAYRRALAFKPDQMEWRLMQARAFLKQHNIVDAQATLAPVLLASAQDQAAANLLLGDYYVVQHDLAAARTAYLAAYRVAPVPETAQRLVTVFIELNDFVTALSYVPQIVKASDPLTRALGFQRWGQILQQLQRFGEAEAQFREGVAADPTYSGNAIDLAPLLRRQGQVQEAGQLLTQGIAAATRADFKASAEHALAVHFDAVKRFDLALTHYDQAVKLQPESAEYTVHFAQALVARGQRQLALNVLDVYLQHHPNEQSLRAVYKQLSP